MPYNINVEQSMLYCLQNNVNQDEAEEWYNGHI